MAQCSNEIKGTVFMDYNTNGIQEQFDNGVSGVTVKAYNANNAQLATAITNSNGNYTLNINDGQQVRLEFSNIPSGLQSDPFASMIGSTIRFVLSPNCGVNLGLYNPEDFCQSSPAIAIPCYVNGDPLAGGTAGDADVLVSFNYYNTGQGVMPNHVAVGKEMGSVWGLAYNKESQKLFSAAFLKRFMGLGELGLGGIYVTDFTQNPPVNQNFIDLGDLGVDVGTIGPRDLPSGNNASVDAEAFEKVGKAGLGDIEISSDFNTLFVVNLKDAELIEIDISAYNASGIKPTAGNITKHSIPTGECANDEIRPFALKYKKGKLYVGMVCSAETSQDRADMQAVVWVFDPLTNNFAEELSFSLDYDKGAITNFPPPLSQCDHWEPWTDDYGKFYNTNLPNGVCYPQAVFSDIEFDNDGSMILSFLDRAGHQLGRNNLAPNEDPTTQNPLLTTGTAAGDLLRAYIDVDGDYEIEQNGFVGLQAGCGVGNDEGPGGGEFYCGDNGAGGERENSMGSLAILLGQGEVANAILNPFVTNSGGVSWMSSVNGNDNRRYEIYNGQMLNTMGKAHGLGDIELLCILPPIEIGDYVWEDTDGDGIQDPGEPGVGGVCLSLYDSNGNQIANTSTDANGYYYFNDINVFGGLQPNQTYYISLCDAQYDPNGGLSIAGNNYGTITIPNANGSNDMNDSDALDDNNSGVNLIDDNGLPYIVFNSGIDGTVNNTLDFGLTGDVSAPCPEEYLISQNFEQNAICSGDEITLIINHSPNVGPMKVLTNIGSILTPQELYSPDNGATILEAPVNPDPGSTTTVVTLTLPENNSNGPIPYTIYTILNDNNPNIDFPDCLPYLTSMIVINPNPVADAGANQNICLGETATLKATGGISYQWSNGQSGMTIMVSPNVTTTYTVTVTNQYGCTDTDNVTVFVGTANANAGPDQTICIGQSATLTASGGVSYQWSNGSSNQSITVSPTQTTTYTVQVTDAQGCTDTDQVTVFVSSVTANAGPDETICLGESTTLTASGGTSYLWSNGQSTASITVSPNTTTTYTITVTNAQGCTDTDNVTVFVGTANANAGPDQTICLGEGVQLSASGGVSYSWSTGQNTSNIFVSPTTTTTYTVTVTDAQGCTDTDQVTVFVSSVTANAGPDETICLGESTTLTASGGTSYLWSNGQSTASITVSPNTTTTYTVTVTNAQGCTDTDNVTVFVGTANANAGPDQTICLGEGVQLSASGGVTYEWSTGQGTSSIFVTPTTTTTYTVTVTDAQGCTDTDQVTVFVSSVTANAGPDQTICLGENATLTASGGSSYQWSNGQSTASITVSPNTTTTYTVTVTNAQGCTDTDNVTVFVGTANANAGPDQTICLGEGAQLSASGGVSYSWSNGQNTSNIFVSPTTTTTYTVTVTDAQGCTDTDQVTVFVSSVTANAGPDQTICLGESATLTASGGSSYQWSNGQSTASITVSPNTTTTYTVTVTNAQGCTDTDNVTVFVGTANANAGPDQTICLGEGAQLSASGGVTYEWSTGQGTSSIFVTPTTTTTYTVTVTDAQGCTDTDQVTVFVSSVTANAGPDQTICLGESTTLTASGGSSYQWSNGQSTASITVSPNTTTTYTVTVTNAQGCTDTDNVTVFVGTANANAGPDQTICLGEGAQLSASGGVSYSWSNGQNTSNIFVSPTTTTTYTVTVTDAQGCTDTDQVTVFVSSVTANAGPDQTICLGESATLTASGGSSYQWSNGQSTASITVSPNTTTTYTVTVTNAQGCTDTDNVTVFVGTANANAGSRPNDLFR